MNLFANAQETAVGLVEVPSALAVAQRAQRTPRVLASGGLGQDARADVRRHDLHAIEEVSLGEHHGESERLFARGGRGAPDPNPGRPALRGERSQLTDERSQLVRLAKEVRLVNDERLEESVELPRPPVVVTEKIVVIEQRIEPELDGAYGELLGEEPALAGVVVEPCLLLDEMGEDRED